VRRATDKPRPFDLLITEIMAHSGRVPDASGEWFEVYARASVDLNDLELGTGGSGKSTLKRGPSRRGRRGPKYSCKQSGVVSE
jgi:hypothetical protein